MIMINLILLGIEILFHIQIAILMFFHLQKFKITVEDNVEDD